jgi:hypothetical protein
MVPAIAQAVVIAVITVVLLLGAVGKVLEAFDYGTMDDETWIYQEWGGTREWRGTEEAWERRRGEHGRK